MFQESDLATLRTLVHGTVSSPGDPGYAIDTAGYNPSMVQRPDATLGAAGVEDIQNAIRWAAQREIPL